METLESNSVESDAHMSVNHRPAKPFDKPSLPSSTSPNHLQHWLTEVGQYWKKRQRAAFMNSLSRRLHMTQQIKLEVERCKSPEVKWTRKESRESMSDMGVALLDPLNYDDEQRDQADASNKDDMIVPCLNNQLALNDSIDVHDVKVLPCHDDIPSLLSHDTMKVIVHSLPLTLQSRVWVRLYSCLRDGDSFPSFLHHVRGHTCTLLVIETSKGDVLGGFADSPWEQRTLSINGCFFGTGQSFLYSVKEDESVQSHRWTALNEYSQFCQTGCVGMGGGGKNGTFGLYLHDQFTRGSSGPCETFGTHLSLCSQEHFEIVEFQVYGFIQEY
jgi:TLD